MVSSWTFFPESPTLILCDQSTNENISKHLSYKLGIYIFVPLTFMSVLVILICYGRILYLIQKHVKSTEKTLGGTKKIKKNKVAPEKENKKKVIGLDAMVNNFMPPGFSIIDYDYKGSRISLASIGKEDDNSQKRDYIAPMSPMDAYKEHKIENEGTSKENDKSTEKQNTSSKKTDNEHISSISGKIDILPTIQSLSSIMSSRNNSATDECQRNNDILSVTNFETTSFKRKYITVNQTEENNDVTSPLQLIEGVKGDEKTETLEKETFNTLLRNNKEENKAGSNVAANDDGAFYEPEGHKYQATNDSEQGKNTRSTDKGNQFNDSEATQCNDEVITNMFAAKRSPLTTRMGRERECDKLDKSPSEQLRMCADDSESTTKIDSAPLKAKRYTNKSCSMIDEAVTDIDTVNRRNNCQMIKDNVGSGEDENDKQNTELRPDVDGPDCDPSKRKCDAAGYGSGYTTEETEVTDVNCKLATKTEGAQKDNDKDEGVEPATLSNKSKRNSKKDGSLKPRVSVVKIYDADGKTVKAKTSRETVAGDICVINTSNKIKGKRKIEAKSAKRAAVVLVTFLIAWLPFPIIIIVSWFMTTDSSNQNQALISAYIVSMTLSLLAASVNPIVYGAINKQFYKEIKKMFKKCRQRCSKKAKE